LFIKDLLLILSDYNIKIVANTEFQNIIKSSLSNSKKRNSLSYIINDFDKNYNLIYNSNIKIKNDFSRTLLSKTGFNWPIIDKEYIDKLLKHY
jgi:hypothetical protein